MASSGARKSDVLTSADVARLLEVNASSVKRWADEGRLQCFRTPGGHRRFARKVVEDFARQQSASVNVDWKHRLADLLTQGRQFEAESLLLDQRAELGRWDRVGDEIGDVLHHFGVRWSEGTLSIPEEHVASECILRCITRLLYLFPMRSSAPICALATAPGDEHTLGLALSELVLAENGWKTMWLGRMCPVQTLVEIIEQPQVRMLALSASSFSSTPAILADLVRTLGPLAMAHDTQLVLGGKGAWPENTFETIRINSFAQFGDFLRFVD